MKQISGDVVWQRKFAYLSAALLMGAVALDCELVLGELPKAKEDVGASSTSTSAGAGTGGKEPTSSGGSTGSAGSAGLTGSGGLSGSGGVAASGGAAGTTSTTTTDSSSSTGTGGCPTCDSDCDGHDSNIAACGGDDCDDKDELVYKDEPYFYTTASKTKGFDYDCSGSLERDPLLDKKLPCPHALACAAAEIGPEGYQGGPPPCGMTGVWGTCKTENGLNCVVDVKDPARPMPCK